MCHLRNAALFLSALVISLALARAYRAPGDGRAIWITQAQIATTSVPSDIESFVTSGFATAGDGGKSCAYFRGADGPGQRRDANGQVWSLHPNEAVPVRCFGAFGRGDVTKALVAAITGTDASATLLFDQNVYAVGAPLPDIQGRQLRGLGPQATTIVFSHEGSGCLLTMSRQWASVRELAIRGPGKTAPGAACGIQMGAAGENPWQQRVDNVLVSDMPYAPIVVESGVAWGVTNSVLRNFGRYGLLVQNLTYADNGDSYVSGVMIVQDAVGRRSGTCLEQRSGGGLRVQNNKLIGCDIGVDLAIADGQETGDILVVGNSIENCATAGFRAGAGGPLGNGLFRMITFNGNELFDMDNGLYVASAAIGVLSSSGNVYSKMGSAIKIAGGSAISIGNETIGSSTTGVDLTGSPAKVSIGKIVFTDVKTKINDTRIGQYGPVDYSDATFQSLASASSYTTLAKIAPPNYGSVLIDLNLSGVLQGVGYSTRTIRIVASRAGSGAVTMQRPILDQSYGSPVDVNFDTSATGWVHVDVKRNAAAGGRSWDGNATLSAVGQIQSLQ